MGMGPASGGLQVVAALIVNNLAALMLWHRLTVVKHYFPTLRICWWASSGVGITGQELSCCPWLSQKVDQGLITLRSRITTFFKLCSVSFASFTTRNRCEGSVRTTRSDKDSGLERLDISNTSSFYQSVLHAWTSALVIRRDSSQVYGVVGEEPLLRPQFCLGVCGGWIKGAQA